MEGGEKISPISSLVQESQLMMDDGLCSDQLDLGMGGGSSSQREGKELEKGNEWLGRGAERQVG